MAWTRMRFRDQLVWVRVDDAGKPVLDGEGRAQMRYRPTDERTYSPSPRNLVPAGGETIADADVPTGVPAPAKAKSPKGRLTGATARAPKALPSVEEDAASAVHVWTDGACTGNPGPMGIGMVVIDGTRRLERGEYLGVGTNNIAELTAVERGLELAEGLVPGLDRPVRVYTDSSYSIGVLSMGWKAKANQELVARLRDRLKAAPTVRFVKVAGHAGIPENERCDELAREAVRRRGNV